MKIAVNGHGRSSLVALLLFLFGVGGSSLIASDSASALWINRVDSVYKVYKNGTSVIANKSTAPYSPIWVRDTFIPQIITKGVACDDNKVATRDFDSSVKFWNCEGLGIQEDTSSTANNTWFQEANISYVIADFDNAETIDIGRGQIVDWGTSVSSVSADRQYAKAKKNTGPGDSPNCDSTNPNQSENCSLLLYFTNGNANDFHITLDNVYNSGSPSSGHEYWYDGPVVYPYYTLTLNPNGSGAGVEDNGGDGYKLVSRKSGSNLLRDYPTNPSVSSSNYPNPTRPGYIFDGWYDSASGGTKRTFFPIDKDGIVLYAHWIPQPTWTMGGYTTRSATVAVPGQQVTFTHYVVNNGPDATGQDIWSDTEVSGGVGVAKSGHSGGQYVSGQTKQTDSDTITIPNGTPAGTQYCQRVRYQWLAYNNTGLGAGPWACVLVAASPYVSAVGGNVWSGGAVTSPYTGLAQIRGTAASNYGSFGEYGVFATSTIDYFGSAGQIGLAQTASGAVNGAKLTFGSAVSLGSFTAIHKISDLVTYYQGATNTPSVMSGTTVVGSGVYKVSGTALTITAIAPNTNPKAVIYAPDATVTLAGDLLYNYPAATSFKDVPSLIVVAKNIVVTKDVTQISGNFYATQKFVTCNEGPWTTSENASKSSAITTGGVCSKQLVVNGTLTIASQAVNSLVLNRSFGGSTPGQAAELVKMRPESFLTSYESNLIFTTIHETELPSRY